MGSEGEANQSVETYFILVGFRVSPELQIFLFLAFLMAYCLVLVGNICMIAVIQGDPQLHTPMYFFLQNLSFIDLSYTSAIAPKALAGFWEQGKSISFAGCAAQFFLFTTFIVTEGFILAAMAYDRLVAICSPLLYPSRMSRSLCIWLVAGSYACGCISSTLQCTMTFSMSFCASRVIEHFYCDSQPLRRITCSNTSVEEAVSLVLASVIILPTVLVILGSYTSIGSAILKIHSSEGRKKAVSTCGSHLGVVSLLYGTVAFVYLTPPSSPECRKVAAVCYTLITPMLNPMIYSLRNKDVKEALKRILGKKMASL
ncbi:olfactory receptor 9K2 [Ornithorhynchus anatinus]|uniref:Olfactory receptor family 9 subfamily K member 2 n=1 Tax=Ornithorhynchus anatinus TaxID=9258 RepID=F7EDJ6_ORNAN|nr:olfactory receptor 9K2 [Ornithorhynchus anatinus]